jgi:hypothetical protein
VLASADRDVFQIGADGIHYDGPLKIKIPLDVRREKCSRCTFACMRTRTHVLTSHASPPLSWIMAGPSPSPSPLTFPTPPPSQVMVDPDYNFIYDVKLPDREQSQKSMIAMMQVRGQ